MWRRRHVYLIAMTLAALAVFPAAFVQPRLLDDLRNFVFDSFQRAAPRPYDPQAPVKIVGIDEASLKSFGQWPWPRTRLAELTDRLTSMGASAIAFDFIFAEPDRTSLENMLAIAPNESLRRDLSRTLAKTPSNDQIFARSIAASPVILGLTLSTSGALKGPEPKAGFVIAGDDPAPFLPHFPAIVAPLPLLAQPARGLGATNWLPDRDQVVRRALLFGTGPFGLTPSLAMEALRVAQGETTYVLRSSNASGETAFGRATGVNAVKVGAFEIATGPNGEVRPRYTAASPERMISAADVLQGRADKNDIEGRIVFVGAKAAGLGDIRATPLEPAVSGVDIHAQIVESLVSGGLLSRPDWAFGLEFISASLFFIGVGATLLHASPLTSAVIAAALIALLFGASFFLFEKRGLLLDPGFPSAAIVISYLVGASTLWRFEQAAKRHVHEAFGKFVAPAVVDRLAENPDRLVLGGETRELTVLFCDLRDFSGLSEGMSAPELTHFMNDYLTPMTDAILEREGTIDKYMGDAILAFWNAPLDVEAHSRRAVEAALAMRGELAVFNAVARRKSACGKPHAPAGGDGPRACAWPLQRWQYGIDPPLRLFHSRRHREPCVPIGRRHKNLPHGYCRGRRGARRGFRFRLAQSWRSDRHGTRCADADRRNRGRRGLRANLRVSGLAKQARRHGRALFGAALRTSRRRRAGTRRRRRARVACALYELGKTIL